MRPTSTTAVANNGKGAIPGVYKPTNYTKKNNKKPEKTKNSTVSPPGTMTSNVKTGKSINFINILQLNTNKSKQATLDIALTLKGKSSPMALIQEPYTDPDNKFRLIPRDFVALGVEGTSTRPRACIMVHKTLTNNTWYLDTLSTPDCAVAQFKMGSTNGLVVSCYMDGTEKECPPKYLDNIIKYAKTNNLALFIGTDSNAHNQCWGCKHVNDHGRGDKLLEYISAEDLTWENVGNTPTFDNNRWTQIIDLTMTNQRAHQLVHNWRVDTSHNSSDHNNIHFQISTSTNSNSEKQSFRDISKTDWKVFRESLENSITDLTFGQRSPNNQQDIDTAGQELNNIINKAYNTACPLIYVTSKVKPPPWETREVREAKKNVRHRLRRARNTKADKDWKDLRSHQAEYKRLVNHSRKEGWRSYSKSLNSLTATKKLTKLIKDNKSLKVGNVRKPNGDLTSSPKEALDVLADTHIGNNTNDNTNTTTTNTEHLIDDETIEKMFTDRRVRKAIEEFNPLSAAGPDRIRPLMLQKGWKIISKPTTILMKASLTMNLIPNCWIHSKGIFLAKPGKTDYHNPKSYRTITLAPVILKLLERIIHWHLEADLKLDSLLNDNQHGFRRGKSTESALHKIINKIEQTIIKGDMALATFLDIEGAFDNISFGAIERALENKVPSKPINNWICKMVSSRYITMEIQDSKKTLKIIKGCPQGGILSPLLWNLVVDDLLSFAKKEVSVKNLSSKIPCDLQAFADDLFLLARGFDAGTIKQTTQKSLKTIEEWCNSRGIRVSSMKTHSIMFTWKRESTWRKSGKFDEQPLTINNTPIDMVKSTKFLGVILDHKLSWKEHIEKQCTKAKTILFQCRKAIGSSWGLTTETCKWIYTAIIRPILSYGVTVWINGVKPNTDKLNSVQRLAHIMTTGGMPSTPLVALDRILDCTPIDTYLEQEAAIGAARLMTNNTWEGQNAFKKKGNLTAHTEINQKTLNTISFNPNDTDLCASSLNMIQYYEVDKTLNSIEETKEYINQLSPNTIQCYTDGSKMDSGVGAGIYIKNGKETAITKAYHLNDETSVFQAEMMAINKAIETLDDQKVKTKNITIFTDSQSALGAIDKHKTNSKTVNSTISKLNKLGKNNTIKLKWVKAHVGLDGNEIADGLAKEGSTGTNADNLKIPLPHSKWKQKIKNYIALNKKPKPKAKPPRHFNMAWRTKFDKEVKKLKRPALRIATQILTGHSQLNYHLHKITKTNSPLCPMCGDDKETTNHFIGTCPGWAQTRGEVLNTHYASLSDIVENNRLKDIITFVNKTKRLTTETMAINGNTQP